MTETTRRIRNVTLQFIGVIALEVGIALPSMNGGEAPCKIYARESLGVDKGLMELPWEG